MPNPRPIKIRLSDEEWTLKRTRKGMGPTKKDPKGLWGICLPDEKEIKVVPTEEFGSKKVEAEIVIHEILHALFPQVDEEIISKSAKELLNAALATKTICLPPDQKVKI